MGRYFNDKWICAIVTGDLGSSNADVVLHWLSTDTLQLSWSTDVAKVDILTHKSLVSINISGHPFSPVWSWRLNSILLKYKSLTQQLPSVFYLRLKVQKREVEIKAWSYTLKQRAEIGTPKVLLNFGKPGRTLRYN